MHPATLLNYFTSSIFLVDSLGFPLYSTVSSANDSFTSFFPIWMPFISFICLIAVARTSKTMLNKSGESGPDQYGSLGWALYHKAKGLRLDSLSGHRPGVQVQSPVWDMREATN